MGPVPADAGPERQQRPVVTIIRCARRAGAGLGFGGAGLSGASSAPGAEHSTPPARRAGEGEGGGAT